MRPLDNEDARKSARALLDEARMIKERRERGEITQEANNELIGAIADRLTKVVLGDPK